MRLSIQSFPSRRDKRGGIWEPLAKSVVAMLPRLPFPLHHAPYQTLKQKHLTQIYRTLYRLVLC